MNRRQFVALTLSSLMLGCTETGRKMSTRPDIIWPDTSNQPQISDNNRVITAGDHSTSSSTTIVDDGLNINGIRVISRANWNTGRAIPSRMNYMGRITRITVHHEGAQPVYFSDAKSTAAHLDLIRKSHQGKGWGDIGYHYVIDRAGRVWQGREIKYAGAHVKNHNPGNVGVMVMGNFERQHPSGAQIESLKKTLNTLMSKYNVPASQIFTHRELGSTACPGRHLQANMLKIRRYELK